MCDIKPMVNQIEFHPGYTQMDTVKYSKENGMLVQAFSPLGCGAVLNDETLKTIAAKYNKSVAQVCLRFVLQSGLNVLTKSVTPSRILENTQIFDFELSADDMAVINAMPQTGFTGWLPEDAPADALV
jgi:diketogulonate reductase-like aldo/keto reductase